MKCPRCHDRGVYRDQAYCDCDTGQRVLALDLVRERLLAARWTPRHIDFWMRAPNQDHFGGLRPLDMVVQGRVDDVLGAIGAIVGVTPQDRVPGAPATPQQPQTHDPTTRPTIPDPPDAIRRVLATKFRRAGKFRLANALEIGTTRDLSADERVQLERAVQGASGV